MGIIWEKKDKNQKTQKTQEALNRTVAANVVVGENGLPENKKAKNHKMKTEWTEELKKSLVEIDNEERNGGNGS